MDFPPTSQTKPRECDFAKPRLVGVPASEVRRAWPLCEPWLSDALKRTKGLLTSESVVSGCTSRDFQLWLITDDDKPSGAAVSEIRKLRNGLKTAHILASGARAIELIHDCSKDFERWAASEGATKLTMDGRLGWARALPGWSVCSVMMEKDIA